MTKVVAWGTGWSPRKRELREPVSELVARARFDGMQRIAAEIRTSEGIRGCVIQEPGTGYLEVRILDWPAGTTDGASLHYSEVEPGQYALMQVRASHGDADAPEWVQAVHFHDGVRRAVLDVPSTSTRYEEALADSKPHAEVIAMRFGEPAFGDYDRFIRPDLVALCVLSPETFDPFYATSLESAVAFAP